MNFWKYLGATGLLACLLTSCSEKQIPSKPSKAVVVQREFSIDDLDYISQDDIDKTFSQLEKELKKHNQDFKRPNLKILDLSYSIDNINFCSYIDYESNTINIYAANIDKTANGYFQTFLRSNQRLEKILEDPFVLEKYLDNEAKFFMKLKEALFYKAFGPADKNKPEEFKRKFSKAAFLDFLIEGAVKLNDGVPEKEDKFYEDVFYAHSNTRGRLFSGIVLDSFNKNWSYFPIGSSFDRMYLGYKDSPRNSGFKIALMFVNAMNDPNLRNKYFESAGINYSKFDKTKDKKYLVMQLTKIPTNLFKISLAAHLNVYYHKKPLKENMPELLDTAKTYLKIN
ncbi:hypothetical protein KY342_06590 [Candidatus Woesearchaeota archaeon]|nr:hypothetical protein [Candidatus Woesearchaeota archaeon]